MWQIVKLLIGLWLVEMFAGTAGCAPTPPDLTPFMTQTAQVITDKIKQEGILDKFAARAEMDHAVEPGVVVEVGLITRVSAYLKGISGNAFLAAEGHGTQMSESTRTALEAELANPKLTIEEKKQIVDFLVGLENPPAAVAETVIAVPPGG